MDDGNKAKVETLGSGPGIVAVEYTTHAMDNPVDVTLIWKNGKRGTEQAIGVGVRDYGPCLTIESLVTKTEQVGGTTKTTQVTRERTIHTNELREYTISRPVKESSAGNSLDGRLISSNTLAAMVGSSDDRPSWTCRIARIRSDGAESFSRNPIAPASMAGKTLSSPA